jgi:hypothetical protein
MKEGKGHKPGNNKFGPSDNSGKYTAGPLLAILCVITILTVGLVCCKSDNYLSLSSSDQDLVNTIAYDLNILVDYENEKIEATCGLTVENRFQHPVSRLPLVLYWLMRVTSVKDEQGRQLDFSQQVVSYEDWDKFQANFIAVNLKSPIQPGARATLKIAYGGYLGGYTETGLSYVRDSINRDFSIIRPDCLAYPQVGVPSWSANRVAGLQAFDYTVRVTVPDSLTVANGGRLIERLAGEQQVTYVYKNILPAWRIDVAIASYNLLEEPSLGLRVFYFKGDEAGARRVLEAMHNCLQLYAKWFGPLASRTDFTVIALPEGYGSQSDVTSILQTRDAFLNPEKLVQLYHELSHLWNVKSLDPLPSRFESEGLAMFLQYLTREELEGRTGDLEAAAGRTFEALKKRCRENPRLLEVPMIDYGREQLTDYSYTYGMLFFYVLSKVAGQEAMLQAVRSIYQSFYQTGATAKQFLEHLQTRLGLNLETFYQSWVFSNEVIRDICNLPCFDDLVRKYAPAARP